MIFKHNVKCPYCGKEGNILIFEDTHVTDGGKEAMTAIDVKLIKCKHCNVLLACSDAIAEEVIP